MLVEGKSRILQIQIRKQEITIRETRRLKLTATDTGQIPSSYSLAFALGTGKPLAL
jgi:hypothetical protein